jgi:hypothetical protein
MASLRSASALLVAVSAAVFLLRNAEAQPTTNDTRFEGYTYVSNVIGYVNMTMDYCDMQVRSDRHAATRRTANRYVAGTIVRMMNSCCISNIALLLFIIKFDLEKCTTMRNC